MVKKYQKLNWTKVFFLVFLVFGFFCLPINFTKGLEVQYPTVSGQDIGASSSLPDYVKYLFNAGMSVGIAAVFISLAIAGAMYAMSPAKPDLLSAAKDRIGGAISGLLILMLTYLIITTINPQLNAFKLNSLPATSSQTTATKKAPGVYFYNQDGCSDVTVQPNTSSISDLGPLKNRVNSVNVVQDPDSQNSYISILYKNTNFWGKCQLLDSSGCQTVTPFASSASIHENSGNSDGDGVYFYREPCFNRVSNQQGDINTLISYCNTNTNGYYKAQNSEINGIDIEKLDNLSFTGSGGGDCGVPQKEQTCMKFDKDGNCTDINNKDKCGDKNPCKDNNKGANNCRCCPTLGGENISSIIINGNYLVLFVYVGPKDDPKKGPWTSCQEFPTSNDVNNIGPQQVKWENIRNNGGVIPNYVAIIPI